MKIMLRDINWVIFVALCSFCLFSQSLRAETLRVGVVAEPTSLDPHFTNLTPNNQVNASIFDSLTRHDRNFILRGALATQWRLLDETTWQFDLRKNVRFHDGSGFDAYDVVFSICRVPEVDSSISFTSFTKSIAAMQVKDAHTLLIKTSTPYPLLPKELASVGIISSGESKITFSKTGCTKPAQGWPDPADFDIPTGPFAVGTGPYKVKSFVKGDQVELERHSAYWGDAQPWDTIQIKRFPAGTPLVLALLKGQVDLIENPPVENIGRIMREGKFNVFSTVTSRVIYLAFNHTDIGAPPTVKGTNGKNPFRDPRVRQAIKIAIHRDAIAERIMGNFAVPANQIMHTSFFGTDKDLPPIRYDVKRAKKLMAEAGYADGFDVTFYATNDRYINDEKIARSIAAMLTRIGIRAKLETMSKSVFFKRHHNKEFAIWMAGWGSASGETSNPLRALVASQIQDKGYGVQNPGGYSNPKIDGLLDQAMMTIDDVRREQLLIDAQALTLKESAIIPIHFETRSWAMRLDLVYQGRPDEFTLVSDVRKFKQSF